MREYELLINNNKEEKRNNKLKYSLIMIHLLFIILNIYSIIFIYSFNIVLYINIIIEIIFFVVIHFTNINYLSNDIILTVEFYNLLIEIISLLFAKEILLTLIINLLLPIYVIILVSFLVDKKTISNKDINLKIVTVFNIIILLIKGNLAYTIIDFLFIFCLVLIYFISYINNIEKFFWIFFGINVAISASIDGLYDYKFDLFILNILLFIVTFYKHRKINYLKNKNYKHNNIDIYFKNNDEKVYYFLYFIIILLLKEIPIKNYTYYLKEYFNNLS